MKPQTENQTQNQIQAQRRLKIALKRAQQELEALQNEVRELKARIATLEADLELALATIADMVGKLTNYTVTANSAELKVKIGEIELHAYNVAQFLGLVVAAVTVIKSRG